MEKRNNFNRNINIVFRKIDEINKIIKNILKTSTLMIEYVNKDSFKFSKQNYLIILKTTIYLFYYDINERKRKYFFSKLDSEEERLFLKGGTAYRIFKHYVKDDIFIDCKQIGINNFEDLGLCSANIYINQKFNHKKTLAYEYDINSAFPFVAENFEMPISFLRKKDFCRNGEIGFSNIDGRLLITTSSFFKSDFIFKSGIIKGFREFFKVYYERKKNAKTKIERNKYKDIMNMSIGFLQLVNPFLRCCIIENLNMYISNIIDKNKEYVIFSNCDSIVTDIDIKNNLKISDNLGDFKIVKENKYFYLSDSNYQWENELPTFRGTPKMWFKEYEKINNKSFDLSKTNVNILNPLYNIYKFDLIQMQFLKMR